MLGLTLSVSYKVVFFIQFKIQLTLKFTKGILTKA